MDEFVITPMKINIFGWTLNTNEQYFILKLYYQIYLAIWLKLDDG